MSGKCRVRITGIKWDTDGEDNVSLPTDLEATFPRDRANGDDLSDWLSNAYGFCHFGFKFRVLN